MIKLATTKSIDLLLHLRKVLLALVAVGAGSAIGLLVVDTNESAAVITSLLVLICFVLLTLNEPFSGLLVWLFCAAILDSWVELPFGAGLPDLSFNRFAVLFLALALLLPVLVGRTSLRHLGLIDLCVLLAPIGFALAARISPQPVGVVQTALSLHLIPAAAYFFAKHLVQDRQRLQLLLWVIACFGIFVGAYAIYESFTGHVLFLAKDQEVGRLYRDDTQLRLIVGLIGSTGGMGRVLVITLLVTIYLIMERRSNRGGLWLIGGALVEFGGLLVTYSRTPLFALLLGLFLLQFCYPRLRTVLVVGALFVALNLAANWQQIQASAIAQHRLDGLQDYNGRTTRWETGLNMWLDRPLQGWGVSAFAAVSGQYRVDNPGRNFDAVENDFLYLLVATGLIGFLPYAIFLLAIGGKSIALFFQTRRHDWVSFIHTRTVVLFWAVFLCFVIGSFTAKNVQPIVKLLPFVIAGAIVGSQEHRLVKPLRGSFYTAEVTV